MRHLKIILVMTGTIVFSGCSTKYINTHVDLELSNPCVFEKFTVEEKESITDNAGRKILRNQNSCRIRYQRNYDILQIHNTVHNN